MTDEVRALLLEKEKKNEEHQTRWGGLWPVGGNGIHALYCLLLIGGDRKKWERQFTEETND